MHDNAMYIISCIVIIHPLLCGTLQLTTPLRDLSQSDMSFCRQKKKYRLEKMEEHCANNFQVLVQVGKTQYFNVVHTP